MLLSITERQLHVTESERTSSQDRKNPASVLHRSRIPNFLPETALVILYPDLLRHAFKDFAMLRISVK